MRILGLDVGETSLGWAVVENGERGANNAIVACGVRLFEGVGEERGVLLSQTRREIRSQRKRFSRKKVRLDGIFEAFKRLGFVDSPSAAAFFIGEKGKKRSGFHKNIYALRAKAQSEKVEKNELFACIYHIAKHRGYRSGPVVESGAESSEENQAQKDEQKIKSAILKTRDGSGTFSQKILALSAQNNANAAQQRYRNREGCILAMADKEMIEADARAILRAQGEFYPEITSDFVREIIGLINKKKTPFTPEMLEEMRGKCTHEKDEFRAPKHSLTAVLSDFLQKINNLELIFGEDSQEDSRRLIAQKPQDLGVFMAGSAEAFLKAAVEKFLISCKITPRQLREILKIHAPQLESFEFKGFAGDKKDSPIYESKKLKIILEALSLRGMDAILAARERVEEVIEVLFAHKDWEECREKLGNLKMGEAEPGLGEAAMAKLFLAKIAKTKHLSLKALRNIEPFLMKGHCYATACEMAGYKENSERFLRLPLMKQAEDLGLKTPNNPQVRKIANQTIKLINELISHKIRFDRVHIELAREVMTKKEKSKAEKQRDENKERKAQVVKNLGDEYETNDVKMMRGRLYLQQDFQCLYCGAVVRREDLLGEHYQIDHIRPLSRVFDDSFNNKVLVCAKCNQEKADRLPLEYLEGEKAEDFKYRVERNAKLSKAKKRNLLALTIDEEKEDSRILNDTRYAARFIKNYIEKHLDFEQFSPKDSLPRSRGAANPSRVMVRNGSHTHILRNIWHIGEEKSADEYESLRRYKKDRRIHTHHAEDAIIIAFSEENFVQKMSQIAKTCESSDPREKQDEFMRKAHATAPLNAMNAAVSAAVAGIFPSKMATRLKKYGQIHEETIKSVRLKGEAGADFRRVNSEEIRRKIAEKDVGDLVVLKRQKLSDKNKAKQNLEKLLDKDGRNRNLYLAIKDFLAGKSGEKCVFGGVEVKGYKYVDSDDKKKGGEEKSFRANVVLVRGGAADRGNQQEYRIYKKDGSFFVGVVFFGDLAARDRGARVQIAKRDVDYEKREYSTDGYEYVLTLHKNDLVYFVKQESKSKEIEEIGYVKGFDTWDSKMSFATPLINDEGGEFERSFGGKKITAIERLEVDMLGRVFRIQDGRKVDFTKRALKIARGQLEKFLAKHKG